MSRNTGMVVAGALAGGWVGFLLVAAAGAMVSSPVGIIVTLGVSGLFGLASGGLRGLCAGLGVAAFGLIIAPGISDFLVMRVIIVIACVAGGGWCNVRSPAPPLREGERPAPAVEVEVAEKLQEPAGDTCGPRRGGYTEQRRVSHLC